LYSGAQVVIRKRSGMIHCHLPGAIQDDQGRRGARSVSVEILFAQRHGHVLQAGVISVADGFDICALLVGCGVGSLRRVAVESSRADYDQALRSEFLPQTGNDGDFGFAVSAPIAQKNKRIGEPFSDARVGGFGPRYWVTCKGGAG